VTISNFKAAPAFNDIVAADRPTDPQSIRPSSHLSIWFIRPLPVAKDPYINDMRGKQA